jgi:membrane protein
MALLSRVGVARAAGSVILYALAVTTDPPEPQDAHETGPERAAGNAADPGLTSFSWRDWLAIVRRAGKDVLADNLTTVASALAYNAFLVLPSVLLVAVGLFGLLGDEGNVHSLVDQLGKVMPDEATALLEDSLTRVTRSSGTSGVLVAIGLVVALWSVTSAMQTLQWGLNIAYDCEETRGFAGKRLIALVMATIAAVGFMLSFGLLILGPQLSTWLGEAVDDEGLVSWLWWAAQWPVLVGGLLFAFAGILYFGPNVEQPRLRFLTPGAVLAVVIWLVASGLFAYYASRFGSYNKAWGSLAAVIVMLVWLWLSGLAILIGAEVNSEVERTRQARSGESAAAPAD